MSGTSPAPSDVLALVEKFREHHDAYRAAGYNETQLRREFIDPLFRTLGWDVDNSAGYAEAYKDVIHEDAIRMGSATKAPDYCFRIGGVRKFFVEAKKPSVDIRQAISPAFQLRRYAWSAKLPLSILTDFEEFAVYDCRVRPVQTDKASKARTLVIHYTEYPRRWHEIAAIFAREAILKGSFDKYAESGKRKRGTAEVDDAFLEEIESWRSDLARNIALRNLGLNQRELNYAVQMTIDRIVFLRICEDRGMEQYGTLMALKAGAQTYQRLFERFRRADEKYNSGLFHFTKEKDRPETPDDLTPNLVIDDKPLKDILNRLYYPESPYEFAVLPADILGQVYEQFLGKVIRLTKGHQAVVEEKPEVRKAGGVYYTPTYIVEYIVRNTVGKLVEGKTPLEVGGLTDAWRPSKSKRPISVLDPACGSGSFLLGAYQFLLDWYRDWYFNDGPAQHATGKGPRLFQHGSGEWRLTIAERKRILLSHIFGVDIDTQAVEVTKLSLLLKCLEGETAETVGHNLRLFHERALPDLAANIKCGNSLIGPDFYENEQLSMFDEEERLRINAFDWKTEFREIMGDGGFTAVIGNPPYVLLQSIGVRAVFDYFLKQFVSARYKVDTYQLFMEQAWRIAKDGGYVGFITPNTFLRNKHAIALRELLLQHAVVDRIALHNHNVFRRVSVDTCVTVFTRTQLTHNSQSSALIERHDAAGMVIALGSIPHAMWMQRDDLNFDLPGSTAATSLLEKVDLSGTRLGDFATAYFGIQTNDRNRFVATSANGPTWKPTLDGVNINRYSLTPPVEWVSTEPGAIKSGGQWRVHEQDRIGVRQIGRRPIATLLPAGWYSLNTIYNIFFIRDVPYDLRFILGLLCSNLLGWYWELRFFDQKRTFPKVKKAPLLSLPIRTVDFKKPSDRATHGRLVSLVQQMLDLHEQIAAAKTAHERTAIQRQIETTDQQIDRLVYELYGLTEEEIRIVEVGTP